MNILFVTSEAHPFAQSGGLGDVSGALPKALRNRGVACRAIMPLYGDIPYEYREKMKLLSTFFVPLAWRSQYCGLFSLNHNGVVWYFIDNEYYFKRRGLYGHYDDGERFAFFSRAVLEALNHIAFRPDVIHMNDWQSALVSVFLDSFYRENPKFYSIKTLLTIHNVQYQGEFDSDIINDILGLPERFRPVVEYKNNVNYLKGGIESADRVNTVSPTYAKELLDPWYSYGLDGLLRERSAKLSGILNGIDTSLYDPSADPYITSAYSPRDKSGKELCKKQLLQLFDLPDDGAPVIGIVSRLTAHKGFELTVRALDSIVSSDIKVIVLGTGEYIYENFFAEFSRRYPMSCSFKLAFSEELAHKIYAGADMFLMPSKQEPCGLAQMIALRYGTVPIVRETGGLADTVSDCSLGQGNGFTFGNFSAGDLLGAVLRAKALYDDRDNWDMLVTYCMEQDFSWNASAESYKALYEEISNLWS